MPLQIPIRSRETTDSFGDPFSSVTVEILGSTHVFEARWNDVVGSWFLDIYEEDETPVLLGARLSLGAPIGWRRTDPRVPGKSEDAEGFLILSDLSGENRDAGFADLGDRVRLYFLTLDEIPDVEETLLVPDAPTLFTDGSALVPTDGEGQDVFVPEKSWHWTVLGIPAPTRQWSTQVASGDLTALIGSGDMIASGGSLLYEQSVSGWDHLLVASGNSSQFEAANSLAAGERFATLIYAQTGDVAHTIWGAVEILTSTEGGARVESNTTGVGGVAVRELRGGTQTVSSAAHAGVVRPYYLVAQRDLTTELFDLFTDQEQMSESASGGPGDAIAGSFQFPAGSSQNAILRGPVVAYWDGDGVDALESAGLLDEDLLKRLGWSIPY
jgi:hypothetical protein